jgi:mRNA-degrading endonuclease RelE of RelBE toxin-antitoxin system
MNLSKWTVTLNSRTAKAIPELPEHARLKMFALLKDIEANGTNQPAWPHYGKLSDDTYHCHIKRGRPTYVVCWRLIDKNKRIIEVYYAGTHEKAPY